MTAFRFAILICTILLSSCHTNDRGKPVIAEEQFISLYADLLILKEENALSRADSLQVKHSSDSLYTVYHVTASDVDASLQYYKRDIFRWKGFYEAVSKRLESLQQQPGWKKAK